MAETSTALGAGAGLLSFGGSILEGIQAQRVARLNARAIEATAADNRDVAEIQAQQAEMAAEAAELDIEHVRLVTAFNIRRFRASAAVVQAQNEATIGASGVTFAGSPLVALLDNARAIEEEVGVQQFVGAIEEQQLLTTARLERFQAETIRFGAELNFQAATRQAALQRFAGTSAFASSVARGGTRAAQSLLVSAGRVRPPQLDTTQTTLVGTPRT